MSAAKAVYAAGAVLFPAAAGAVWLYAAYTPPPAAVLVNNRSGEDISGWEAVGLLMFGLLCMSFLCWFSSLGSTAPELEEPVEEDRQGPEDDEHWLDDQPTELDRTPKNDPWAVDADRKLL
jgi:hypothetical protein